MKFLKTIIPLLATSFATVNGDCSLLAVDTTTGAEAYQCNDVDPCSTDPSENSCAVNAAQPCCADGTSGIAQERKHFSQDGVSDLDAFSASLALVTSPPNSSDKRFKVVQSPIQEQQ